MLKSLSIRGFRNHAFTKIVFSASLTPVLGPTGAGKTSLLASISSALLGSNHWTGADGRGAQKMIRQGAKTATLICEIEGIGTIKRIISPSGQALTVEGCNAPGTRKHQEFLLDALGTNAETLFSLLNLTTVLSHKPADQFALLLAALRPPVIEPSDLLKENKIEQIATVADLLELIKYRKDVVLRGLKRELSAAEQITSEAPVVEKPPDWPLSNNMTEENVRVRLKARQGELANATSKRDRLQGRIDEDEEAKKRLENVLPADTKNAEAQEHRLKMIKVYRETVAEADKHIGGFERDLEALQDERSNLLTVKSKNQTESEALAHLDQGCPTCKRPWPADAAEASLAKRAELGATLANVSIALDEKDTAISTYQANLGEARTSRHQIESLLHGAEVKIASYEAAQKAGEPLEVVEARLDKRKLGLLTTVAELANIAKRVEAGEQCVRKIEVYYSQKQALDDNSRSHATRMQQLAQDQIPKERQIISELEAIKKSILDARVAEFEDHVNGAMKEMGQPDVSFDLEFGWMSGGRAAAFLSTGQAQVCFEAAYRYALAKTSGVPLMVVDHLAPVNEAIKQRLMKFLYLSGLQVVMAWTAEQIPTKARPPGLDIYWVSEEDGTAVVSRLPEAKAA